MIDKEVRIGVLERAQELLSMKKHWLQGEMCVDKNGDVCKITSTEAVSFCLLGAIRRSCCDLGHISTEVVGSDPSECPFLESPIYRAVLEDCFSGDFSSYHVSKLEEGVGSFNDEEDTRYADIAFVLARAVESVEEEEELEGDD